jgi:hypothetical protein
MSRNGFVRPDRWLRDRAALAALCLGMLGACGGTPPPPPAHTADGASELAFEPNRGQADEQVRFIARGDGYTAFLTATETVLVPRPADGAQQSPVVRMRLVGGNQAPAIAAEDELPGKVHYVDGVQPSAELTDIPTYRALRYSKVYPAIDVIYYGNGGRLEYDFVVAPGGDPQAIAIAYDGAETVEIDAADGALVLKSGAGEFRQPAPTVYQQRGHAREPVDARWQHAGSDRIGIRVGAYDRSLPLVIDPLLLYSSYLGGRGDDGGHGIAVDTLGNTYLAGKTTSPDFPGTPLRAGGANAAFVTKLNAAGQRLYSTLVRDTDEHGATAIALDGAGNAYVTGRTSLNRAVAGNDVFVAKLDAAGRAQAPGYFATFGGSHVDWSHHIAVDAAGRAHVAGKTMSRDFPTTPAARQNTLAGDTDGFVAKLNASGTALVYATLLGGGDADSVNGIALDALGNAYVTGGTTSIDFPVTAYAWQRQHRGCNADDGYTACAETAFVAKLNATGSALAYSTYLGGSGFDQQSVGAAIAVDGYGRAFVTGSTTAENFPTTAGVLQPRSGNRLCFHEVCTDAFVTKLSASGSAPVYSTYLFGESQDEASAIAIDASGNAYVAGSTASRYFPVVSAFQPKPGSFRDAFVAKLNTNASRLLYASYLGGQNPDDSPQRWSAASAIAIDASGNAHLTGQTYTTSFPTTVNAMQRTSDGGTGCGGAIFLCGDAFVTKIAAGGPGIAETTTVGMASTRAVLGATIQATWAGVTAPLGNDRITLHQLGHSDEPYDVWGGWYTTGAASGTIAFALPATLATGWYELRLWSGEYSQFTPLARSAPFEVYRY